MQRRRSCLDGIFGWGASLLTPLIAGSILGSCFLLTEGQVTITLIQIQVQPEHPIEGHNVTLTPKDPLDAARTCRWHRGRTTDLENQILTYFFPPNAAQMPARAFTNRETAGPGCSLHIRNLTSGDTGNYTVNVNGGGINAEGYASIVVTGYNNSYPEISSSAVGAIAGIIIGSLAVTALIVGILLYFFLRACGRSETASMQTTAATLTYENDTPSRQVKTDSTADSIHIYQALQHADQSVYQQLKGSRQVSQPSPQS